MGHVLRPVVLAHEGDERHLVLLRQMLQHVIGADLGAADERVGQHLGEKQDLHRRGL
jgi:hypothetical protein